MGTVCCGTNAPPQFVGTWSNQNDERLTIYPNGCIFYLKQMGACRTRYKNCPAQFEDDSFRFCCCYCCALDGKLEYGTNSTAQLVVNGSVLTKAPDMNHLTRNE